MSSDPAESPPAVPADAGAGRIATPELEIKTHR
jgi:hypothetical protein